MIYTARDLLGSCRSTDLPKVAIREGDQAVSYMDLRTRVDELAAALQSVGAEKGDRVAIYLPHSADEVAALLAVWEIACVAVIIDATCRRQQIQYLVTHSGAKAVVSSTIKLPLLDELPIGRERILNLDAPPGDPGVPCRPPLIGGDLAMLLYTSGSTGLPKGVMLSHANLLAGARIVSDYLHLTEDDTILSVLPFSFDYGLNQLLTSLLVKGTLVIQRSPLPADICRSLRDAHITGLAGVPLLWQELTQPRSLFMRERFPELRYITNSGGRMPGPIVRAIREVQPHVRIYLMYGLTEAFRSTYLPPEEVSVRPDSIGKAIPDCEIMVLNSEGKPCRPGETGELVHRGPTVASGYWRDPEASKRVFRPNPLTNSEGAYPEMVVYSGDLVRTDEDGFLYFVGRRDEMIKSRGRRISAEEVEEVVHRSGLVAHAVFFAVPKNDVENLLVLAVVPREPEAFSERDLMAHCKRELPEYMCPDIIWTNTSFPKTSTGKPDRVALKQEFIQEAETRMALLYT